MKKPYVFHVLCKNGIRILLTRLSFKIVELFFEKTSTFHVLSKNGIRILLRGLVKVVELFFEKNLPFFMYFLKMAL